MEQTDNKVPGTGRLVARLLLTVVGMFAFGFALVPLYDAFCDWTGLNGKTGGPYVYEAESVQVDESREVTVQFMTSNNAGMSWVFEPLQRQVKVHPGAMTEVRFIARNPTDKAMVGQAIPSVSPFKGADYLHKTECFCFTQQRLEAGEEIEMPLLFFIDQALPKDISKLTLSYTLFDVTANFVSSGTTLSANQ
jgi:cytochrome c oxidase assembly protein subunit 11